MKLERIFILAAIVATLVTIPAAATIKSVAANLDATRQNNTHLLVKLDSDKKPSTSGIASKSSTDNSKQTESKRDSQNTATSGQQGQKPAASALSTPAPVTPAPKPAPTPAPVVQTPPTTGCAAYEPIVAQYGWDVRTAMAIMQAESGCRAVTPDNSYLNYDGIPDYGLFQLHGIAVTDPAENIRIAYTVKYLGQGWSAWSTYTSGAYLKYLK